MSNHTGKGVLATADWCGMDASDPEEQEDNCWQFWEWNVEFYDCVLAYYKANHDVDIDVHEKDRVADSELDDKE